ncbi:KH domain-containing protein [Tumebacillus flagellatus]|uniref:RNA-binding protein KhpA n=1 Tax=Tumebacillus flagellatus TaxID=1157490 RepID=A0A074LI65_9BACL|nr:KH domain-containing protein [Tumebacillus flagellatus]KEO81916.1 hypothetical protein EL26_17965 [Tumebacillus flagellatus]
MKQLVETIAKALVDQPDQVRVTEVVTEDSIVYELSVFPSDMGKIIGKQGRVAKALRTVVAAAAAGQPKKVTIEIV